MSDKQIGTATVTPLPTMMPGGPHHPRQSRQELQRELTRDVRLSPVDGTSASTAPGPARQLTADQTIRHLATQHALTFNREEDLTLEELLADAATIERYIAEGVLPDVEDNRNPAETEGM